MPQNAKKNKFGGLFSIAILRKSPSYVTSSSGAATWTLFSVLFRVVLCVSVAKEFHVVLCCPVLLAPDPDSATQCSDIEEYVKMMKRCRTSAERQRINQWLTFTENWLLKQSMCVCVSLCMCVCVSLYLSVYTVPRYGGGAGNTVEENSSVFSLIRMH